MRPSAVLGQAFKGVFALLLLVRRPRPIHPRGVALQGTIRWLPRTSASGIRWIDEPRAPQTVSGRVSRSVGLPPPLPDVVGLALRFEEGGRLADLELASTGFGVPSRFVLAPHRSPSRARLNVLLPYRGTRGPVLICARTIGPRDLPVALPGLARRLERQSWRLRLYWAAPTGTWHPFAELELTRRPGPVDSPERFDAVRHPLPGAGTYDWVRAVRQPSYHLTQGAP
jgi:hypothetical protein